MSNRDKRTKVRRRRGFTLLEMAGALAFLIMMGAVIVNLALGKTNASLMLDAQYKILAADAWLAEIYSNFHSAESYEFQEFDDGEVQLKFTFSDGRASVYSHFGEWCYSNGVQQFRAKSFDMFGAGNFFDITVKLPDERLLKISVYL